MNRLDYDQQKCSLAILLVVIIPNQRINKVSLLFFGLSGISAVFLVIRVFPVNLGTVFFSVYKLINIIFLKNGTVPLIK